MAVIDIPYNLKVCMYIRTYVYICGLKLLLYSHIYLVYTSSPTTNRLLLPITYIRMYVGKLTCYSKGYNVFAQPVKLRLEVLAPTILARETFP